MIPCEETYGNMSGDNNTGADSSTMNVEGTSCETLEEISLEDQSVSSSQDSEDQIFQREIRIFQDSFLIISEGSDFSFRSLLDLFFGRLTLWWLCSLRKANSSLTSPLRNGEELQFLEFFILCYFYDCSPGLLCSTDCRDAFVQPIMGVERFLEISNSLSGINHLLPTGLDPYFTTAFKYFSALSSCLGGLISFAIDQIRQETDEQSHQHDEENCLSCGTLWEKLIRASLLNAFEVYCILYTIGQSSISEPLLFKEFHESLRSEHNFEVFLWQFREEILLKESIFYCRPKVSVNDGLSVGNSSSGRHEYNLRDRSTNRFSALQSEMNDSTPNTDETTKITCFSFKSGNFLLMETERLQENCRKAGNNVADFSLNSIFLIFFGGESVWWSACLQLIDAALVKQNLSPLVDGEGMEFLEYLILSRFYHCPPSSLYSGDLQAAYSTPIMKEERFSEIVSALENSLNEENASVTSSLSSLSMKIGYSKLMLVVLNIESLLMNETNEQHDNDDHRESPITLWATVKKVIRVALLNIFLLYRAFHGVELLVKDSMMLKSIEQFQDYLRLSYSSEQCLWGLRKEILSMEISSFSSCFESTTVRTFTEDPRNYETMGEGMELFNCIQSKSKKRKGKEILDISTSNEIVPDEDYGNTTKTRSTNSNSSGSSPPKKKKAISQQAEKSPSSSSATISLLPSPVLPQSPDDQSIASCLTSIHSQFSDNPVSSSKRQPRIDWFNTERGNQLRKYPINHSICLATSSSEESDKNNKRKKRRKHCLICRCFTETSCEICQVVLCTTDNSCLNLFGPRENNNCFEFFHSSEVITAFF
jgi:hypothetical protein